MVNTPEVYTSLVPDWASHIELVVHEPDGRFIRPVEFKIETEFEIEFIVATLSTPNGYFPPYLDASFELVDPNHNSYSPSRAVPRGFSSAKPALIFLDKPQSRGTWQIGAESGVIPYAVTVMAFHPQVPPHSPPSPGPSAASPFKCRACKITAKALALAIVAAATLPALPASLIAAVATYLGVGAVVAAAFIGSVIGDTADIVSEKLCKKVGLC